VEKIEGKLVETEQDQWCIRANILLCPGDVNRRTRGLMIIELKKILRDCEAQIRAMGRRGNIPLKCRPILTELKKVIKNREEALEAKLSF